MAAFRTAMGWAMKNQGLCSIPVVTVAILFHSSQIATSNTEAFERLGTTIEKFDTKIKNYHVKNWEERIAGEHSLRAMLQSGLSQDILPTTQNNKN